MTKLQNIKMALAICCLLVATAGAAEKKNTVPKGDFLGMAALLVKDGHYQRALMALQNVDTEAEEADLIRYYTLEGLAYLSLNDLPAAKHSLQQAVANGQTDRVIYVYLAQTHYGLKEYRETVMAVDKAGDKAVAYPGLAEMQAQSYWNLKQYDNAFAVLNKAQEQFPQDQRFLRRKVFYLVELGLYRMAADVGLQYLQQSEAKVKDYIAIGNALRLSRQYGEALRILELAQLQFPDDTMVAKVLAHTYLDQGMQNTAAQIFEQAAIYDPALLAEAGEIYRRAGRFYRALSLNAGIADRKIKLKQRLALLLALKRYEAATNMQNDLYRVGLLNDQTIRYALAYANFNIGRYKQTKRHLEYLKEPDLFKKGIELRRVMAECQQEPWQCV